MNFDQYPRTPGGILSNPTFSWRNSDQTLLARQRIRTNRTCFWRNSAQSHPLLQLSFCSRIPALFPNKPHWFCFAKHKHVSNPSTANSRTCPTAELSWRISWQNRGIDTTPTNVHDGPDVAWGFLYVFSWNVWRRTCSRCARVSRIRARCESARDRRVIRLELRVVTSDGVLPKYSGKHI